MTKRSYPWPNNCCYQMKSHIGLIEVANGVNGRNYIKDIKDYTNALLIEGAKKFYSNLTTEECLNLRKENTALGPSQRTITSFFTSERQHTPRFPQISSIPECQSCVSHSLKCQYCNKRTCTSCGRICSVCCNHFCSTCSILRYDLQDDAAVCFECVT